MPRNVTDTNGQAFTPATASGLVRRAIRSEILKAPRIYPGVAVQSKVDGSLIVQAKASQVGGLDVLIEKLSATFNANGFVMRVLESTPPTAAVHRVRVACDETVSQGVCGSHFYRGTGEYALSGARDEAWRAGGIDPLAPAEDAPEAPAEDAAEAPAEAAPEATPEPVVDVAAERAASRSRRSRNR
jgi:hypothetical protein